jgi:hypothetical protein
MCLDKLVAGALSQNKAAEFLSTLVGAMVVANSLGDATERVCMPWASDARVKGDGDPIQITPDGRLCEKAVSRAGYLDEIWTSRPLRHDREPHLSRRQFVGRQG